MQNAEDAGAQEMGILFDNRNNNRWAEDRKYNKHFKVCIFKRGIILKKFVNLNARKDYSECEVFQKEVFCVSPRCESPSYKYYLIMIWHSFSPKMRRKTFENRFTNKHLTSKNVFE